MADNNNTNRRIEELEKELAELKKKQNASSSQNNAAYRATRESQDRRKKLIEQLFEQAKLKNALDGIETEDPAEYAKTEYYEPKTGIIPKAQKKKTSFDPFGGEEEKPKNEVADRLLKVTPAIVGLLLLMWWFNTWADNRLESSNKANQTTTVYTPVRTQYVQAATQGGTTPTTSTTEPKVATWYAEDLYQQYYTNTKENTSMFHYEYYYIRGRIADKYDDGSFFYFETGLGESIDKYGQFLVYVNDEFEPQVKDLAIGDYVTIYGRWQLNGYEMVDGKTVPDMTVWDADLEDGELDKNHYEQPSGKIYTPEELYLYFEEVHPEEDTAINGSLVCVMGTVIGGEYNGLYLDIGEENYPDWPYKNYNEVFCVDFGWGESIAKYHVGDEVIVYGVCNAESWMEGVHMVYITEPAAAIVTEVGGEDAAPTEAATLYQEFRNDHSAAKEKYNKKDITLRGTVSGLSPMEGIVYIKASGDHTITCFVEDVSAFTYGNIVDLHGMLKYDGFYTDNQKGFCAMLYLYVDSVAQPEPAQ